MQATKSSDRNKIYMCFLIHRINGNITLFITFVTMKTVIIADAGGTKIAWAVIRSGQSAPVMLETQGFSPLLSPPSLLQQVVSDTILPVIEDGSPVAVYYYGAGVVDERAASIVREGLALLGASEVEVASDMLGAARATLGSRAGVAAIMGTGANSCLYDGSDIIDNIPSMGYIIADEGSGASLGKRFVADLFQRRLPQAVVEAWNERVGLSRADILDRVYRAPGAQAFLASLAPFIHSMMEWEEVSRLVDREMDAFFERIIVPYDTPVREVGLVGSIAAHFTDRVEAAAHRHGFNVSKIVPSPIDALVEYHTEKIS